MGEKAIWNIIKNSDKDELEKRIRRGMIQTDQKISGNSNKIDKSEFHNEYKYLQDNIGIEKYWKDKEIKGKVKETCTRMRSRSVGREWKRSYENMKYRRGSEEGT